MSLATWWRGDRLPPLRPLAGFYVRRTDDTRLLTGLTGLEVVEIERRLAHGHQPYVAHLDGVPVAYGWVATRKAEIGELKLRFSLPTLHRYLWDFATLPAWRGRGIYPRLLQEIILLEGGPAYYFWIIHAPENRSSRSGIRRAGFTPVGQLSLDRHGRPALAASGSLERARMAAAIFAVPLQQAALAPCWHCGGAAYPAGPEAAGCRCWTPPLIDFVDPSAGCRCAATVR